MSFFIGLLLPLLIIAGVYFLFKKQNLKKSVVIFYLIGKTFIYIAILYFARNLVLERFGLFLAGFGAGFFVMIFFFIFFVISKTKERVNHG